MLKIQQCCCDSHILHPWHEYLLSPSCIPSLHLANSCSYLPTQLCLVPAPIPSLPFLLVSDVLTILMVPTKLSYVCWIFCLPLLYPGHSLRSGTVA